MISVEKVSTRDELARLEDEWNTLLANSTSDTITLTHQWLLTWWDVFGQGRELCVLLARSDSQLVGIAPLLRRRVRRFGLSFRRIEFLASGEDECDEICSDYLDFILARGHEEEALDAMMRFLVQDAAWDELLLSDIAGDSPNLVRLQALAPSHDLSWQTTREQMCIFLPLPGTRDELLQGISSQNRKRILKDRRVAEQRGARVQVVDSGDDFEAAFAILVQLHQDRWIARGLPGSFASEKFTRFHHALAPQLLRRGWLKLWILWLEGAPIYALYDFVYAGKIFYYQSGMSGADSPIRSPGLLLRDFALEDAIACGLTECDFLKGEANSYKFGWGGQTRPIVQVRLARGGAREAAFGGASRVADGLRPVKRRVLGALRRQSKA